MPDRSHITPHWDIVSTGGAPASTGRPGVRHTRSVGTHSRQCSGRVTSRYRQISHNEEFLSDTLVDGVVFSLNLVEIRPRAGTWRISLAAQTRMCAFLETPTASIWIRKHSLCKLVERCAPTSRRQRAARRYSCR